MASGVASSASSTPTFDTTSIKKEWPLVEDFLSFMKECASHFHAVEEVRRRLLKAGFHQLNEKNDADWNIKAGGKYFFTRNQSTIFAFAVGGAFKPDTGGFSICAAHTDSPVLKLKPVSHVAKQGYIQLDIEPYGGGLWHTWFDRDLSLAGRVIVANSDGSFTSRLVRVNRPILRVPSLAIHLNREVNDKGFQFNLQGNLLPVLATAVKDLERTSAAKDDKKEEHSPIILKLVADELRCSVADIRQFELCLYDTQPPSLWGAFNEFIAARGLDNLCMSFISLRSLLDSLDDSLATETNIRLVALFDNEEVGSASEHGAASNMMSTVLKRILGDARYFEGAIARSMLISADMAHGVHPNYADKHEDNHRPALHGGLVVKYNGNQRYATTAVTSWFLTELAKRHRVPLQRFAVRNDMPCGSTIGPILSSNTGIRTVDVGVPQLSMHSIRETCATEDILHAYTLFRHFFVQFPSLDKSLTVDAPSTNV